MAKNAVVASVKGSNFFHLYFLHHVDAFYNRLHEMGEKPCFGEYIVA
ncbi:hypothetical protein I3679_013045 [Proteus mirabilis]|uniref:Uncharacterized protein n=1 Tax=Proteus mirabilis TaxID=584 RepID=A0ABD5LT93_PROMI